jgi:hypothetical protein
MVLIIAIIVTFAVLNVLFQQQNNLTSSHDFFFNSDSQPKIYRCNLFKKFQMLKLPPLSTPAVAGRRKEGG